MITRRKLQAVPSGYLVSQFPVLWKTAQRSDVSSSWDSWTLETSQVDTTLSAPMFRLCMCFAILMNANGLIFDHRKTSPALLLASGWIESKTAKTLIGRKTYSHLLLPYFHEPSRALRRVLRLVTDFGEKMTLKRLTFCHQFAMFILSWANKFCLLTTLWITWIRFC